MSEHKTGELYRDMKNKMIYEQWDGYLGKLVNDVLAALDDAYNAGVESAKEQPDTQERIDSDTKKFSYEYWNCKRCGCYGCKDFSNGCAPALKFGVTSCAEAQMLDLLRRQRKLDKKKGM